MNLLSKYILREWCKLFFITLLGTLGVVLIERLYDEMHAFLSAGVSAWSIAKYFVLLIPNWLGLILPISLFVSILLALGSLHRSNEIVAMRAAGLSLLRICASLFYVGGCFTLVLFLLAGYWVPKHGEDAEGFKAEILHHVKNKKDAEGGGLIFNDQGAKMLWYVNSYNPSQKTAHGISVYEMDPEGKEIHRFYANRGRFSGHWTFEGVRELTFSENGEVSRTELFDEPKEYLHFKQDPEIMMAFNQSPAEISWLRMRALLKQAHWTTHPQIANFAVHYYKLFATPFNCILLVAIAAPFVTTGVRKNPIVGVAKATGLFFCYYVLVNISYMLGGNLVLSPILAAWLPNIVMAGVAGWYLMRWERAG